MSIVRLLVLAAIGTAGLAAIRPARAGEFDSLLARVPSDANALVLVDPAKARGTKYAQAHWENAAAAHPDNGYLFSPHELQRGLLASNLDMQALVPVWNLALFQPIAQPALKQICDSHGGRLEKLGNVPAAWLPCGAYVVLLGPHLTGVYEPAERQAAARWVKSTANKRQVGLSPVLADAARSFERNKAQMLVALDLQDSISPGLVRARLAGSPTLAERHVPVERVAPLLASVQGVTLTVLFDEDAIGTLAIQFGQDAGLISDFALPLVLEISTLAGARIDEMRHWTAKVDGDTLTITGRLQAKSIRQIVGIVSPPSIEMQYDQPPAPSGTPPSATTPTAPSITSPVLLATQRYYKSLEHLVEDIAHPERLTGTVTPGAYALWLQSYAKKIDKLPILNVDRDLVNYGAQVSGGLRHLGVGYKSVGIQAGTASANVDTNWGTFNIGGYGSYGSGNYGGYDATLDARSQALRQGTQQAAQAQADTLPGILDGLGNMRRVLTDRYQTEF